VTPTPLEAINTSSINNKMPFVPIFDDNAIKELTAPNDLSLDNKLNLSGNNFFEEIKRQDAGLSLRIEVDGNSSDELKEILP